MLLEKQFRLRWPSRFYWWPYCRSQPDGRKELAVFLYEDNGDTVLETRLVPPAETGPFFTESGARTHAARLVKEYVAGRTAPGERVGLL